MQSPTLRDQPGPKKPAHSAGGRPPGGHCPRTPAGALPRSPAEAGGKPPPPEPPTPFRGVLRGFRGTIERGRQNTTMHAASDVDTVPRAKPIQRRNWTRSPRATQCRPAMQCRHQIDHAKPAQEAQLKIIAKDGNAALATEGRHVLLLVRAATGTANSWTELERTLYPAYLPISEDGKQLKGAPIWVSSTRLRNEAHKMHAEKYPTASNGRPKTKIKMRRRSTRHADPANRRTVQRRA